MSKHPLPRDISRSTRTFQHWGAALKSGKPAKSNLVAWYSQEAPTIYSIKICEEVRLANRDDDDDDDGGGGGDDYCYCYDCFDCYYGDDEDNDHCTES